MVGMALAALVVNEAQRGGICLTCWHDILDHSILSWLCLRPKALRGGYFRSALAMIAGNEYLWSSFKPRKYQISEQMLPIHFCFHPKQNKPKHQPRLSSLMSPHYQCHAQAGVWSHS